MSKRLYLEAMRDIYENTKKIVVDNNLKAVSYLPLTELNKSKSEDVK